MPSRNICAINEICELTSFPSLPRCNQNRNQRRYHRRMRKRTSGTPSASPVPQYETRRTWLPDHRLPLFWSSLCSGYQDFVRGSFGLSVGRATYGQEDVAIEDQCLGWRMGSWSYVELELGVDKEMNRTTPVKEGRKLYSRVELSPKISK